MEVKVNKITPEKLDAIKTLKDNFCLSTLRFSYSSKITVDEGKEIWVRFKKNNIAFELVNDGARTILTIQYEKLDEFTFEMLEKYIKFYFFLQAGGGDNQ